jgi:hypothetical protein
VTVYDLEGYLVLVAVLLALTVKAFAFVNALLWPSGAYAVAGRGSKRGWLVVLGLGLALQVAFVDPSPYDAPHLLLNLVQLGFAIVALVFVLDVRPALTR